MKEESTMKIDGEVEVFVRVGSGKPKLLGTGTVANGGCLSLKFPLQPAPGETILLKSVRSNQRDPYFTVDKLTPRSECCQGKKHQNQNGNYVYHLSLSIDKT